LKKIISITTMITLICLGMLSSLTIIGSSQETRIIKILSAQTGLDSILLGSASEPIPRGGYPLTVNVILQGATDYLYTVQIVVRFNRTYVRCAEALIPKTDPSFVFFGKQIVPVSPIIDNEVGSVILGVSLIGEYYVNVQTSALLCQLNFAAIKAGTSAIEIIMGYYDTFLLDKDLKDISFTSENFTIITTAGSTPPVASFKVSPENPSTNQNVTFDASESYDPNGEIVSYVWDFGDGNGVATTEPIAIHNYTSNGVYFANLTIFDDEDYYDSLVREVQVGRIPYVNFTYAPSELRKQEPVTFNASLSYDPDGSITHFVWNFGDGNLTTVYDPIVTHSFYMKGIYMVNLTVYDNENLHNSSVVEIFVGKPPTASFTFRPANPHENEVITFDASSSHAGESEDYITLLVWDFGDYNITEMNVTNLSSNLWIIQHVYRVSTDYIVNLTVYDNNGLYNSITKEISIQGIENLDYTMYYVVIGVVASILIIMVLVVVYKRRHLPPTRSKKRKSSETRILGSSKTK